MKGKLKLNPQKRYCISAQGRKSGERMDVTGVLTTEQAKNWEASHWDKKAYKYFRISEYPYYKAKEDTK